MTPNIFSYNDFRDFIHDFVKATPNPRGQFRKMALALNVSTTMISQVFSAKKVFSLEAASDLSDYLGLNELEAEFFLTLVELDRCTHFKLKKKIQSRLSKIKTQAEKLETRLPKDHVLTDANKTIFYSDWIYSAVRNLSAIEKLSNADALAAHLNLSRAQIQRVLKFLMENGLLVQKGSRLESGPKRTHLNADSPLISMHHRNWRIQGMQKMAEPTDDQLFYTGPMSLSDEVAEKVRSELPAFIEKVNRWVYPSKSEVARCLNIDWFAIK